MTHTVALRQVASRAAANLVAVVAISAIFGLKAYIDNQARNAFAARAESESAYAATSAYDPYFTGKP